VDPPGGSALDSLRNRSALLHFGKAEAIFVVPKHGHSKDFSRHLTRRTRHEDARYEPQRLVRDRTLTCVRPSRLLYIPSVPLCHYVSVEDRDCPHPAQLSGPCRQVIAWGNRSPRVILLRADSDYEVHSVATEYHPTFRSSTPIVRDVARPLAVVDRSRPPLRGLPLSVIHPASRLYYYSCPAGFSI